MTAPRSISPQPNFAESDGRMNSSIIAQGELKAQHKGRRVEGGKKRPAQGFSLCVPLLSLWEVRHSREMEFKF